MKDELTDGQFGNIAEIMTAAGLPPAAINTFNYYYRQLVRGETGIIPETEIMPVATLPEVDKLDKSVPASAKAAVQHTVMIKLNGGLGTSMGLERAKSLIPVKSGMNFLDIIARQAICSGVPLLLMNSFATRADTLAVLSNYPELDKFGLGLDFVQHKVPKINRQDLQPARWPRNPQLEWCPPGHGDIYTALLTSGMLERLLAAGYRYAFISNADNLGATLDQTLLGYLVQQECAFLMEVADRTATDSKGGHLARHPDGRLLLREAAQCRECDITAFQDFSRHKYFNTNNLWLDLTALRDIMSVRDNVLGLPLICNSKTIDPRDDQSTGVWQLETAMGAAISVFDGAQAIRVPRTRFAPVKTTNDLFVVRSDAYVLNDQFQLIPGQPQSGGMPRVDLDGRYYQTLADFEERVAYGVPSLSACRQLTVSGDVKFGRDVTIEGTVKIINHTRNQVLIGHNTTLRGEIRF